MKGLTLAFLCVTTLGIAQTDSEIFLLNYTTENESFSISEVENISKNSGYDSQPSFFDTETLIYSGTRNEQTEILAYNIKEKTTRQVNAPTAGGEYSPQRIPDSDLIAAVRLDPDGLQRIYTYSTSKEGVSKSEVLITDYKIAYFAFHDNDNLVASTINNNKLELIKANLSSGKVEKITTNSGRAIHKVPGTDNVSYTSVNNDGIHEVYIINIMGDNESYYVCDLPVGIQDHCWLTNSELLLGSGSKLYSYDLFGNAKWEEIADLSQYNISEINRITMSPNKSKIALVATPIITTKE